MGIMIHHRLALPEKLPQKHGGKAGSVENELPPNATFLQEVKPCDRGLLRDNDGLHNQGKLSRSAKLFQLNPPRITLPFMDF